MDISNEVTLMQQASFDQQFFLLYAKGNTSLDLVRWIFGGAISPELLVKSMGSTCFPLFNHLGPNEASYSAHRHVVSFKGNGLWHSYGNEMQYALDKASRDLM